MGTTTRTLIVVGLTAVLAACGNDSAKPDAPMADAAVDAPAIDAPLDSPAITYDFSCSGVTPPTMASGAVTVSGTTESLSAGGLSPVANVAIDTYDVSAPTVSIDSVASDNAGAFTTGTLNANDTTKLADVFLKGAISGGATTYRTSYIYPPYPLAKPYMMLPFPMVSDSIFQTAQTIAGVTQDDTANGVLVLELTDCAGTPIDGATLSVQQNSADVGTVFDVGQQLPQAAGTYVVFNVPDGATQVTTTVQGTAFPTFTVDAHKKPNGAMAEGTITATQIRPGP